MVEVEKGKRKQVSDCLTNINFDIEFHNQNLTEAQKDIHDWRHPWEYSLKEKKEMREGLKD